MRKHYLSIFILFLCVIGGVKAENNLASTIKKVEPSVVGVGVLTPIEGNRIELRGTGFVFGGGRYIATNYHVVEEELSIDKLQYRVIFSGKGRDFSLHKVKTVDFDPIVDLAILEIIDKSVSLPNKFKLGNDKLKEAGTPIAFTGFPIGAVLGLYPATHKGIVAAVTPNSTPARSSSSLTPSLIEQLKRSFSVYQLDATAFPGNSGSAMYIESSGEVIGIINKVIVQGAKEYALSAPSGITYAIPVKHLRNLAARNNITLD